MLALAGLGALAAAALLVLRGSPYEVRAHFVDAGQLVEGGSVKVAGRKVGSIADIRLTDDGRAEVVMHLTDAAAKPLREGTRAAIRALSQAGVANRYVELSPGSEEAPELPDGAVLPVEQTESIVNLDAVLNSFGPVERRAVKRLIKNSSRIFAGSSAPAFRSMLAKLDPALAELDAMMGELARDDEALERVIAGASRAAGAIASRKGDLENAVSAGASAMNAIARERESLARLLDGAPDFLVQGSETLRVAADAAAELRPALRGVPATAKPLKEFLGRTRSMLDAAVPAVRQLRAQLPSVRDSLAGLEPLRKPGSRALRSAGRALRDPRHILRGMRFYGTDLLLGVLSGLAAIATANYTQYGHYARLEFVQPPQTVLGGSVVPDLLGLDERPLIPGLFDLRTRLLRRCPGGNTPPAPDGSSPWVPDPQEEPELAGLCSPEHNTPASVNDPPSILGLGGRR